MAAPHSTSLRALRAIAQSPRVQVTGSTRNLHMTGSHPAPAHRTPSKPAASTKPFQGRSLADLRAECRNRGISSRGSAPELADRLSQHEALQSRAFSIAMRKIGSEPKRPQAPPSPRPFNTSRAAQAPHDSSPIDFAFLPASPRRTVTDYSQARVPILPDGYTTPSSVPVTEEASVMKPEIYTVSDPNGTEKTGPSPTIEVTDNHAVEIDPFKITDAVEKAKAGATRVKEEVDKEKGVVRGIWEGFVEDVMGKKEKLA
ncbi:MAG: hypothetical protein Q9227_000722 [Pyrenula ochraceoflavens]